MLISSFLHPTLGSLSASEHVFPVLYWHLAVRLPSYSLDERWQPCLMKMQPWFITQSQGRARWWKQLRNVCEWKSLKSVRKCITLSKKHQTWSGCADVAKHQQLLQSLFFFHFIYFLFAIRNIYVIYNIYAFSSIYFTKCCPMIGDCKKCLKSKFQRFLFFFPDVDPIPNTRTLCFSVQEWHSLIGVSSHVSVPMLECVCVISEAPSTLTSTDAAEESDMSCFWKFRDTVSQNN